MRTVLLREPAASSPPSPEGDYTPPDRRVTTSDFLDGPGRHLTGPIGRTGLFGYGGRTAERLEQAHSGVSGGRWRRLVGA
jgi:hypothetical protein